MFKPRKKDYLSLTHRFHLAVRNGDASAAQALLGKGADPNLLVAPEAARYAGNAYHAFASVHHRNFIASDVDMLRLLGLTQADINLPNQTQQTPLHLAAGVYNKYPASAQVLRGLLMRGANPHARDGEGCTALQILCADKATSETVLVQCAAVLVEQGARIDERGRNGVTAMMLAAANGRADLYAYLLQKRGNPHARDHDGLRASDHARAARHYALAESIRQREELEPETHASFDSTVMPKVEWNRLSDDRISRVTIEDPIRYKLTEIFNFRMATYTCITQNLYTKAEAVTVRSFHELDGTGLVEMARAVLARETGRAGEVPARGLRGGTVTIKKPPSSGV